jgi:uncharacterized membrane protein
MKIPRWSDERIDTLMGNLLRTGVVLAALVVAAGGVLYLVRNGNTPAAFHGRHGVPPSLRSVTGIASGARSLDSRSIIQLGLLLLIATPVARVAFALIGFALQRDRRYVIVSAIVLGILILGMAGGIAAL